MKKKKQRDFDNIIISDDGSVEVVWQNRGFGKEVVFGDRRDEIKKMFADRKKIKQ